MTRNLLKLLIGLLIGAFFVWLSAKDWPLAELSGTATFEGSTLTVGSPPRGWAIDLWWLLPYFGILSLIHVLRVIRWKPLLDPITKLSLAEHNRIGAVGFMAMFLFPLRLGELVRPHLVKQATQRQGATVNRSEVLATVVVERVVDGLVVSLMLFGVLFLLPDTGRASSDLAIGAYAALAVFAGAAILLAGARWQNALTRRVVAMTAGLVSKRLAAGIDRILGDFLRGLASLSSPASFLYFVALTVIYWGLNGLGVWCMVQAFALPVDMLGSYAMMACVVVGMMIPNSPGNVGSFWYFLCLPAPLYGLTDSMPQVIAFGISVWLMQLFQQTLFGLWFIARGRITWRGVMDATHDEEAALPAETRPISP